MPRKTRQQKIIADLRRKVQNLEISYTPVAETSKPEAAKKTPVQPAKKIDTARFTADANLIKKDLRKTFIISSLAIVAELVLYLATK